MIASVSGSRISKRVPAPGARGTVVLVHGLNRSRIENARKLPFLHAQGWNALLFDLRQMADFTLDMAWEEIKFSRAHSHDFGKIAVLTDSQWVTWSAWLSQIFVDADLQVFDDEQEARSWLLA